MSLQAIYTNISVPLQLVKSGQNFAETLPTTNVDPRPDLKQFVCAVPEHSKTELAIKLLGDGEIENAIVYVKTNSAADDLADKMNRAGITAESFHGNKSQRTRLITLANFRGNRTRVLVATESATSDICVANAATIINYSLPVSAETYTRRLNHHRTSCISWVKVISFCDKADHGHLLNIKRVLGAEIQELDYCLA